MKVIVCREKQKYFDLPELLTVWRQFLQICLVYRAIMFTYFLKNNISQGLMTGIVSNASLKSF